MNQQNQQPEKHKVQRRYNHWQYKFLKLCSEKGDEGIERWNQWRKEHWDKHICLKEANLCNFFLEGAYLGVLWAMGPGHGYYCGEMFPVQPKTQEAEDLQEKVDRAGRVYMEKAQLQRANLKKTLFWHTDLKGADLNDSHVEGAEFWQCNLKDADVRTLCVDNRTMFWGCHVNRYRKKKGDSTDQNRFTNFEGVPLENVRMNARAKHIMEYNIRRLNWEDWYNEHSFLKFLVKPFWQISDYGISTKGIIKTFLKWAFIFAVIYYIFGQIAKPGVVDNLFTNRNGIKVQWWLVPFRTLYFSIVTMTTLGFGDMFANAHSLWGHILLSLQVILGYVLLGALVTRFAVLFTAGGPAGTFFKGYCPNPKIGWDELAADKTILQTGDVIHVQNRGLLSKLVRFFSRAWKEEPSWASHTAIVLRVGEEIEIIEAMWTTVIRSITTYKGKRAKLLACRKPGGIDQEQKKKMIEKAEYYKGKTYGYYKIALHVLDRLLNNRYVFRRLIKDNEYPICSWLVAYVYDRVLGYHFGTEPNAAQPDDLLDHCLDYEWEFIWADSGKSVADLYRTYKLSDKNDIA